MLSYQGVFFEGEMLAIIYSNEAKHLPVINDEIHCTFKYCPSEEEIFDEIVGQEVEVYLIGHGFDENNSGFQIAFPKEYNQYYINYDEEKSEKVLKVPHITSSIAEGAKASNTKNLKFKSFEKPIKIIGRFGYWIKEEDNEYISYAPYKTDEINERGYL